MDRGKRDRLLRSLVVVQPESKEELWYYYAVQYGMELVRRAECDTHNSQLDVLWDILSGSASNYLVITNRHGGKTFSLAGLMLGLAVWQPNTEISVISGCISPWTGVVIRVRNEGRRNGVYVVPAALVREGWEVWTLRGWRPISAVIRTKVDEMVRVTNRLGYFVSTPDHQILVSDIEGNLHWERAGRIHPYRDFAVYPMVAGGEELFSSLPASSFPDPEIMGFGAAFSWHRWRNFIHAIYPQHKKSSGDLRRQREQVYRRVVNFLASRFGIASISDLRRPEFSWRVLQFPAEQLPGVITSVPIGRFADAPVEWRMKFLETFFKHAFMVSYIPRREEQVPSSTLEMPRQVCSTVSSSALDKFFLPSSVETYMDKVFTVCMTLAFLGLDFSDFSIYYPRAVRLFPARTGGEVQKLDELQKRWREQINRPGVLFRSLLQPEGDSYLSSCHSYSFWRGRTLLKPLEPVDRYTIIELQQFFKKCRRLPEWYFSFIDLEIEDADNFMTLDAGIIHNSKRQTQRWRQFFDFIYSSKPQFLSEFDSRPTNEGVRFRSGSSIHFLSSSETSARSPHSDIMIMDEVEEIRSGVFEAAQFAVDLTESGFQGKFIALSTHHRFGGNVEQLKNRFIDQPDSRIFEWCMLDVIAPCRDSQCRDCELRKFCRGIAKRKKEGFLTKNRLIALLKRVSTERFEVEMLLSSPRSEGALLKSFRSSFPWVQRFSPFRGLPIYRGVDFGTKTAVVWAQYDSYHDRIWIVDSFLYQNASSKEIVERVFARERQLFGSGAAMTWGDARAGQIILDFQSAGMSIITIPFRKKPQKIDTVRRYLELRQDEIPGLILHARNEQLIKELLEIPRMAEDVGRKSIYSRLQRMGGFHLFDALVYLVDGIAHEIAVHPLRSIPTTPITTQELPSISPPKRRKKLISDITPLFDQPDSLEGELDIDSLLDNL